MDDGLDRYVRRHHDGAGDDWPPTRAAIRPTAGRTTSTAYVYEEDFEVVGPDVYDLDGDGDGIGCESD